MNINNSQNYIKTIQNAKLADYGPIRGEIVILPYGVQIWKRIVTKLTHLLEETGHEQVYFPLLIPESFFEKEKQALPGFCPSNYTVTRTGNLELSSPLVIRPTSELMASYMFGKWINSYRDLPIKMFQWANVVRNEKATHPFIKGTEIQFLEGHTVHSTHKSAIKEIDKITDVFYRFFTDYLKLPIVFGEETATTKFAGSLFTRIFDTITPNGRALQLAAVYDLGQLFAKQFSITYRDADNKEKLSWTTDWGLGFRLIGALALIHSDDRGLRLPSTIAPYQVCIILLTSKGSLQGRINNKFESIRRELVNNGIRNNHIVQGQTHFGKLLKETEAKGIPITLLIGDDEVMNNYVTLIIRDKPSVRSIIKTDSPGLSKILLSKLDEYDASLYTSACKSFNEKRRICFSKEDLNDGLKDNWGYAPWCGKTACEKKVKESDLCIRMIVRDDGLVKPGTNCLFCEKKAKYKVIIAKKY